MEYLNRRSVESVVVGLTSLLVVAGLTACQNSIQGSPDGSLKVPDQITFRQISVGSEDIQRFTLRNEAGADGGTVEIKKMKIRQGTDDDKEEFEPVNPDNFPDSSQTLTLKPGEEKSWQIAYRPENGISDNGAVTFQVENDPDFSDSKAIVPLETREMSPRINYAPAQTLNFSTDSDNTGRKFVKVTNTGRAPLQIDNMELGGSQKFTVSFAKPSEVTCSINKTNPFPRVSTDRNGDGQTEMGPKRLKNVEKITPSQDNLWPVDALPETIEPQGCFAIIVSFNPTDNTPETATIDLETNAEPATQTISLAGNSDAPCLEISARDVVQFGVTSVNGTTSQTVRVRNCRKRADPLKISSIRLVNKNGVFAVEPNSGPGKLFDGDPSTQVTLEGDQQASFTLTATPKSKGTFGSTSCSAGSGNAAMIVNSNDPAHPKKRVCLTVTGDDNACPTAVAEAKVKDGSGDFRDQLSSVRPLDTVQFDGTQSSDGDGSINRYEWTILERPQGSTARLVPNPSAPKPEMFLDLAGEYRVELKVFDDEGTVSCGSQAIVDITAVPQEAIHVQLVWDTPADPDETDDSGADVDLHFLNPKPNNAPPSAAWSWNNSPFDIYYDNKTEDWGEQGVSDDNPSLDIDDTDGAGPENINLDDPPNTGANPYKVGVYYFDDHGYEESYATVRIFIRGNLKKTYKNKYLADTYTFWHVCDIGWPNKKVSNRNTIYPDGFP